jgi:hypothetical protein
VYFETDEEIRRMADSYGVGDTPHGLWSIIGPREVGRDIVVGPHDDVPMPPPGSGYPPWTPEEAGRFGAWIKEAP